MKTILPDGSVKIDYEMSFGVYSMRSSLTFSAEQYKILSEAQIEAIKQSRFDDWLDNVLNPYTPPEGE